MVAAVAPHSWARNMVRVVGTGRLLFVVPVVLGGLAAGCGTTDQASRQTLPPIRTTTSSTTTPTTTFPEGTKFYTIKRGETLAVIAASFGVTVQSIVDLNQISNPDAVQAGQTIEIPTDVILVAELPDPPVTTTN